MGRTRHVHFVGIGGIGMSGIAEVLLNLGFVVSGSDHQLTDITNRLCDLGATIHQGHQGDYVSGADVVVISSAVRRDNAEVQAAISQKIPVIRRAEMLGELMRMKQGIAIGGTHGKTTTTSMAGLVVQEGGFDPTVIVGGKLRSLNTNAKLGTGDYLVVEADEYDRSFLQLTPMISVITNIETEHLDCYKDLDEIKETFVTFANKVPFYGAIIVCLDEPGIQEIMPKLDRPIITYGLNPQAQIRAIDVKYNECCSEYTVLWKNEVLGQVKINLPGVHNIKNSLAAIGIGLELEMPFQKIQKALSDFTGVHRRFEIKDKIQDVVVVDDYAHHPTEIEASLKAARKGWNRRIVAVFQPHLYSRTRDFYHDFGQAFFDADVLIVTEIYPAREDPIPGITGTLIADEAKALGHQHVVYVPEKNEVLQVVEGIVRKGDIVITLGAGDIWKTGEALIETLKKR